ncbi:hypothetical protein CPB83DRAFT_841376 [Crepidotus variabilis]|uniref:Uncharacterized protein n=1 Tax=Crepidotus variabilis TaxID=179855 RepID=A0A9P6BDY8_9AGAR|nr:hypothetical protein CPB83DRAFT_841376 [Crepidotus variabilis]
MGLNLVDVTGLYVEDIFTEWAFKPKHRPFMSYVVEQPIIDFFSKEQSSQFYKRGKAGFLPTTLHLDQVDAKVARFATHCLVYVIPRNPVVDSGFYEPSLTLYNEDTQATQVERFYESATHCLILTDKKRPPLKKWQIVNLLHKSKGANSSQEVHRRVLPVYE